MLNDYPDIEKRIKSKPLWYDKNGTPRYDKFTPYLIPNIYATEALLVRIACQSCGKEFLVDMDFCEMEKLYNPRASSFVEDIKNWIKDKIKDRWFPVHFGDPPNHGCVGDTMNCIDLEIVEFWNKEMNVKSKSWMCWKRNRKFEIKNENKI